MTKLNYIGIDFEYTSEHEPICCAAGKHVFWLYHDEAGKAALRRYISANAQTGVFICHCLHMAEGVMLPLCAVDIRPLNMIDTWAVYKIIYNSVDKTRPMGLAALSESELGVKRDCEHKGEMQKLCAFGTPDEINAARDEILAYCKEDVDDLPALWFKARDEYKFDENNALRLTAALKSFTNIAKRGLPVSEKRLSALLSVADEMRDEEEIAFSKTYDIYETDKHGKRTCKRDRLYKCLYEDMRAAGYTGGDCQDPNNYKDKCEALKDDRGARIFAMKDGSCCASLDEKSLERLSGLSPFAAAYRKLKHVTSGISTFTKNYARFDGCTRIHYESLEPLGTVSGRCTPKPARGFIPTLSKDFYCLLEPADGKVLFELDYSAQETLINAVVSHDKAMLEVYSAKDPYLWLLKTLGTIPADEYERESKGALKAKYGEERQQIKKVFLGWSYGAGAKTIAANGGIPEKRAKELHNFLNKTFAGVVRARYDAVKQCAECGLELSDGFRLMKSDTHATLIGNWPIQSRGAQILRFLVYRLECDPITRGKCIATIHDAVLMECDETEYESVKARVLEHMHAAAVEVLGPAGEPIRAAEAFCLHHGEALFDEAHSRYRRAIEAADPGVKVVDMG